MAKLKRQHAYVFGNIVLLAGIGLIIALGWSLRGQKSDAQFSQATLDRAKFKLYYPVSREHDVDWGTASFSAEEQVVVFKADYRQAHTKLTFTEQSIPPKFERDDQAYDQLVSSMKQIGSFRSKYGKVFLTRPSSQGDRQTAVMLTENTLMFVRADDDMTDEQWRQTMESLMIAKQK